VSEGGLPSGVMSDMQKRPSPRLNSCRGVGNCRRVTRGFVAKLCAPLTSARFYTS